MPAGAAAAERGVPCRTDGFVFGLCRLPEHEVARILLGILIGADPLAGTGPQLPPVEL
jgi:hypothetical protein